MIWPNQNSIADVGTQDFAAVVKGYLSDLISYGAPVQY
jgi:hypothetical protein